MHIELSNGKQTLSAAAATAAANAGDISALADVKDYTLTVEVSSLSAASGTPGATIAIEDAVDGAFTALQTHLTFEVAGPVDASAPVRKVFRKRDCPWLRLGTASAKLRSNVTLLKGTTPSLSYRAWLETVD